MQSKEERQARANEYYRANREKIISKTRSWQSKNIEKIRENGKKYRTKNADKIKLWKATYRKKKRGGKPPQSRVGVFNNFFGRRHSKETIEKMVATKKRNGTLAPPNKGKKMSDEARAEMKKKMLETRRKTNPAWGSGVLSRGQYFYVRRWRIKKKGNGGSHTLADWQTLKAQYNWTCPACHRAEPEIKLTEDHIIPLSKGGSDNIENIQPLCRSCNSRKHTQSTRY